MSIYGSCFHGYNRSEETCPECDRREEVEQLRAENEKWKKAGAELNSKCTEWAGRCQILEEENTHLKAELAEAKKDAGRFHWLTEDHPDRDTRTRCRGVLDRMAVLSYSGACLEIDVAMKGK